MFRISLTRKHVRFFPAAAAVVALPALLLSAATWISLQSMPRLSTVTAGTFKAQLLDRDGRPLTVTYQNRWNHRDVVALHDIPLLLQQAFVVSEDKRFFQHGGVDWRARLHAAWQDLLALGAVRGASTISEQVVRMLHPRPRTLWSRWLEGFEAQRLGAINNKADILEFYLNQVPYAAQRRGVVQAAGYYFNRDLATLTEKEMLALAVMVRAPAHFNVHGDPVTVERHVRQLAMRLREHAFLDERAYERLDRQRLHGSRERETVQAEHFARYVYEHASRNPERILTTLDSTLQNDAQRILDQRLDYLDDKNIDNAALLAVDHRNNEILAWVVGRNGLKTETATAYDAVRTPRQPGSALKPFVYALALSKGWTATTLIDDSPLSESVGHGLHTYHNYSHIHYGPVSLRNALGNSLNIPAVKAMQFVGPETLLDTLHKLGIRSLDRHPDYYGDGLALGNGELTLFELVQAYSALARGGVFVPLHAIMDAPREPARRVFSEPVATLIGNILSDPEARRLEFGDGGLLNLPLQTAVKTGTSSDYRDAWAVGYNHRYTVGVWMGNLRGEPMNEITGSTGPALVLRALFAELNRYEPARPLPLSPLLVKRLVCIDSGRPAAGDCPRRDEWFVPGTLPAQSVHEDTTQPVRIRQPHPGLQLALDPRIPDNAEAFRFQLDRRERIDRVDWYLNGVLIGSTNDSMYNWPLQRGRHVLMAKVHQSDPEQWIQTQSVEFQVK